jgi:nucleoside-diphosphate-sugar epimerase
MKKINILTGASGFLGKLILEKSNIDFLTLGRTRNSDIVNDLIINIPNLSNINLIVHCAGLAHFTPKKIKDENLFYNINVVGLKNLLSAFSTNNLPNKFVFISSVSVYGLIKGESIDETSPLLAKDPYGKSKIEAEQIIKDWCSEHNVIYTILRLPLVIGENPPGNLGSMIKGIKNGYYFNIADGNAKKSMVLASDIANFILKASEVGGTFNLTDGYHPSIKEISKIISFQLGKSKILNLPYIFAYMIALMGDLLGNGFPLDSKKLAKITSTLTFDDTKARCAFRWEPTPVLKGIKIKNNVQ